MSDPEFHIDNVHIVNDFVSSQDQALAAAAELLAKRPATFLLLVAEGTAEEIDADITRLGETGGLGEANMGFVSFGHQVMLHLLAMAASNILARK